MDAGGADHRSRKSPTAEQLRVWRAFAETSERLKNVVALRLQADSDLSTGDYAVMVALSEQPHRRMRSSQLADHISWQRSRLSHHLGRMERRGLVTRETAVDDSRGAVITLTPVGAGRFRSASPSHLHAIHDTFVAALNAEQLAALENAMQALDAHLTGSTTIVDAGRSL